MEKDFFVKRSCTQLSLVNEEENAGNLMGALLKLVLPRSTSSNCQEQSICRFATLTNPLSETFDQYNFTESNEEFAPSPSPKAHKLIESIQFKSISRVKADEAIFKGEI